jgi:hypothetical protein
MPIGVFPESFPVLQVRTVAQGPVLDIVRNVVKRLEWTDSELPLGPQTPIE